MKDSLNSRRQPLLLRFLLSVGQWAGFAFVPAGHVQVIYRMGLYNGVKGPGLIRYDSFLSEKLGPQVFIGMETHEHTFSNVITRDNLSVTMKVSAALRYNPNDAPARAPQLTRLPQSQRVEVVKDFLHSALLAVVNRYTSEQLTQYTLRTRLQHEVSGLLAADVSFLGFTVVEPERVRVLDVKLPERITERHELNAQRRLNILASSEFMPDELRRALIIEVLEKIGAPGSGKTQLSFGDALQSIALDNKAYAHYIEQAPPPRPIEPPAEPEPPQASNEDSKPRMPKSRL
jgi:SPFH domain/Band 7 family protein